jgi:Fe-S-cluster containining protein
VGFEVPKVQALYRCEGCGECCRQLFGKKFGAAIANWEKVRLELLAGRLGVSVNFYPLSKNLMGQITTWQFSDNKCPFLNKFNRCMVYYERPLLCRAFPLMPFGVGDCNALGKQSRVFAVKYHPGHVSCGREYLLRISSLLKSAVWLYSIDRGKWELNRRVV